MGRGKFHHKWGLTSLFLSTRFVKEISNYNPVSDEFEVLWTKNIAYKSYASKDYNPKDSKTVALAGRFIEFVSVFGCPPCTFVVGAITVLGSLGLLACVATNS